MIYQLRETYLFKRLVMRMVELAERQKLTHYHIHQLENGDTEIRENFRIVQRCYTNALNLSIEQVRAYMDLIDLDELQGFSVPIINRRVKIKKYNDNDDDGSNNGDNNNTNKNNKSADPPNPGDPEPSTEETSPNQAQLMGLNRADEEIMASRGSGDKGQLEAYLNTNVPSYSAPSVAVSSGTQESISAAETPAEDIYYEDNGFYLRPLGQNEEVTDILGNVRDPTTQSISPSPSWADEVEEATENGVISSVDPIEAEPTRASSDLDTSTSPPVDFDEFLTFPESSPSDSRVEEEEEVEEDGALSEELQELLAVIGGYIDTTRTNETVALTEREFAQAETVWLHHLSACARRAHRRRHVETWEETNRLDNWDWENSQFYWQTEGLFLCRLTELVYKRCFEDARATYLAAKKRRNFAKVKQRKKGKLPGKLPGSPLRNEFFV
ncbi:hypothetical protein F5Y12DRAFT_798756 [Xylaria sp. FL1777]|nr:hypothetical protein F5Y12DRAFT_798756 [Xylaria sp. FL1777]